MEPTHRNARKFITGILICILILILLVACGSPDVTKTVIDKTIREDDRTQWGTSVAVLQDKYYLTIQTCPNDGGKCSIDLVEVSKATYDNTLLDSTIP